MKPEEITKLIEYADLEGCEIGEYVNTLLQLRTYSESHGMPEKFSKELDFEMNEWLTRFKEDTVIESENVVIPSRIVVQKTLEWL